MVQFQGEQTDEIAKFVDARYVSASEACWRLFHFDLQDRYPSIQRLALHLPNQKSLVYIRAVAGSQKVGGGGTAKYGTFF